MKEERQAREQHGEGRIAREQLDRERAEQKGREEDQQAADHVDVDGITDDQRDCPVEQRIEGRPFVVREI